MNKAAFLSSAITLLAFALSLYLIPVSYCIADEVSPQAEQMYTDSSKENSLKKQSTDTESRTLTQKSSAMPSYSSQVGKVVKGLLYCIATLIVISALLKRFSGQSPAPRENAINIIAKRNISQKAQLLLIEVQDKQLLISHAGENVALISELDKKENFQSVLSEEIQKEGLAEEEKVINLKKDVELIANELS